MVRPAFSIYVTSSSTSWDSQEIDSERSLDKLAGLSPAERLDVIANEAEWFYSGGTADDDWD